MQITEMSKKLNMQCRPNLWEHFFSVSVSLVFLYFWPALYDNDQLIKYFKNKVNINSNLLGAIFASHRSHLDQEPVSLGGEEGEEQVVLLARPARPHAVEHQLAHQVAGPAARAADQHLHHGLTEHLKGGKVFLIK